MTARGHTRRVALLGLCTMLACLWLWPPAHARATATGGETVRVGWCTQPGYMALDEGGNPVGYLQAYLQAIAQRTGWRITYVQGEYGALLQSLAQGDIDLMGLVYPATGSAAAYTLGDLAAGTAATLVFTASQSTMPADSPAALDGATVGLLQDTPAQGDWAAFAAQQGIRATPRYFDTMAALLAAVNIGAVDAGIANGVACSAMLRPLLALAPRSFYFAVSSARPQVLAALNAAMGNLAIADSHFQERLAQQYLQDGSRPLALTQQEQAYLASSGTLTVAYGKTWEPLVLSSGAAVPGGVAAMLLARLQAATGTAVTYVPLETASSYDLLLCVPQDHDLAVRTGLSLSTPYITMPLKLVSRTGLNETTAAAADEGFAMGASLAGMPIRLTYYSSARACLDAVLNGSQPAALLNSFVADRLLHNSAYQSLTARPLEGAAVTACFAVPTDADPRLLSILNQLVGSMSQAEMYADIITYIVGSQPINLAAIADQMPTDVTLVTLAAAVLLVALLAAILLRHFRTRREHARTAEITAFLDYAKKVNDDVWEVNIHTQQRWRYRMQNDKIIRVPMPAFTQDMLRQNLHPDDLPMVQARVHHMFELENAQALGQQRFDCRIQGAGGYRWSRVVFQGMMPTPRHPASVMVYIMDIDDTVRAEEHKNEQLQQALLDAENLSRARGEFAAYISHEIRSPLNAMLGYLMLARSSIGNPERLNDCFVKSEYAATHLLQLVGGVLDMGSLEKGKLRLNLSGFDVVALLDTLASIYNAQAKSRGIAYHVETLSLPERYLIGDDLRVKQVIVNLLSNAMKFTPAGGTVTLSAEQLPPEGQTVRMRFRVADTGIGMPEAFQKNLFDAYAQSDIAVAGHFGGSGLGLNISRSLTDLMGGRITVESAENRGTTFTVELPFTVDVGKRALTQAQPDARLCFAGMRLLLAEDNDLNMEIATELLRQEGGFAIDGVSNGSEAVKRFVGSAPGTYSAILMDVRMPVLDGYQATQAIRQSSHPDAATVPILAMTANAFDEDVRLALAAGMNGHIPKPIDFHHVLLTLSEHLTACAPGKTGADL